MHRFLLLFLIAPTALFLFIPAGAASDQYGAIAFSKSTSAHGYSYDYYNRATAEKRAVSECNKRAGSDDCKVVIWFKNACGALAVGDSGSGAEWGETAEVALFKSLASCVQISSHCEIVSWACTGNADD